MPVIDLAVEVAYTDFGKPSQGVNAQQFEIKLRGPSIAGLLILVGPLDLYAKAGLIDYELIAPAPEPRNQARATIRSTAQASVYIWKLAFRAEYERYEIQDFDRVDMVWVHVLFQF